MKTIESLNVTKENLAKRFNFANDVNRKFKSTKCSRYSLINSCLIEGSTLEQLVSVVCEDAEDRLNKTLDRKYAEKQVTAHLHNLQTRDNLKITKVGDVLRFARF